MRAAVVTAFDKPPSFGSFPLPTPGPSDVLVNVKASAVSSIARFAATGAFGGKLPLVPGLEGVGTLADSPSKRVYFAFPPGMCGALAEIIAIARSNVIPVPDHLSDIEAAAFANPAMAVWVPLTRRTQLKRGETVLINGATGTAGRLAVQICKHLGAGRVIATGRSEKRLAEAKALGADEVIVLQDNKEVMVERFKAAIRGGVDVILDYLWGASAEQLAAACLNAGSRAEQSRRIRWINVGSASGPTANIVANALRSSPLEMLGSGLGSQPDSELLKALGEAFEAAREGGFKVDTWTAKLEDVEKAWATPEKDKRLVITM